MQDIIEQLQHQRALLFLGREVLASDALCAVCSDLARLPFRKVISWDGEEGPRRGLAAGRPARDGGLARRRSASSR